MLRRKREASLNKNLFEKTLEKSINFNICSSKIAHVFARKKTSFQE